MPFHCARAPVRIRSGGALYSWTAIWFLTLEGPGLGGTMPHLTQRDFQGPGECQANCLQRPPGMKRVVVWLSIVGAEVGLLFGAMSSSLSWTGDFEAPPIAATGRKAAERAL